MTRDELIEVLTRTLVGEDATDDHLKFCRSMGANVLTAIEAQGLAIVPVEPDDAFWDRVDAHSGRHSRSGETYPVQRNFHRAMIEAAKL